MVSLENLSIFLPKFLSSESTKVLFDCLNEFPNNLDERLYTTYLKNTDIIYQGDGLKKMLVVNMLDKSMKHVPSMVLSNTCDVDLHNTRLFHSNIVYSPILNLHKYEQALRAKTKNQEKISGHIESIRKQHITQIFYLPEIQDTLEESIVFLDRLCHCPNNFIDRDKLSSERTFTLSDYGAYLFLLKLSFHFTRIQDQVERGSLLTS